MYKSNLNRQINMYIHMCVYIYVLIYVNTYRTVNSGGILFKHSHPT